MRMLHIPTHNVIDIELIARIVEGKIRTAAEHDNVKEGVGAKTVCAVHRGTGSLTGSVQTRDQLVACTSPYEHTHECL